jgi:hypothetical protein
MKEASKHIIYNAEDIYNYFSGKLTPAEMHAMEKAALTDPLLAEAMEGFHESSSFKNKKEFDRLQKQLNELKNKVAGRKTTTYNNWWKAAAAVLLLIGITIAVREIMNTPAKQVQTAITTQPVKKTPIVTGSYDKQKTNSDVAINTKQEKENPRRLVGLLSPIAIKKTNNLSKTTIDTIKSTTQYLTDTNSIASNTSPIRNTSTLKPLSYTATIYDRRADSSQQFMNAYNYKADNNLSDKRFLLAKKRKALVDTVDAYEPSGYYNLAERSFAGKITDSSNNPIPFASLVFDHHQSKADENGLFNIIANGSSTDIEIDANGYSPKIVPIVPGNFQIIVLKKTLLRKDTSGTGRLRSNVLVLYKQGAEPTEGWTKYLQYMVDQLSYSAYDDGRPVKGDMIVSFKIDINSFPTDFNFEKSIDDDINNAVKQLIEDGPSWKKTKGLATPGTIRLRIIF